MLLIIDGYNVLKNIFSAQKNQLERQRETFIKHLGVYLTTRKIALSIYVVFDGGSMPYYTKETYNGITVIYSGHKQSADNWIVDFAHQHSSYELLIVTNDRQLISRCKQACADTVTVTLFYQILTSALHPENTKGPMTSLPIKTTPSSLQKFAQEEDTHDDEKSAYLDELMFHTPLPHSFNKELHSSTPTMQTKNKQLSKKEQLLFNKLKKLL